MKHHKLLFLITEDWYFWSHRLLLACAARDAGFDVVIATRVQNHGGQIRAQGLRLIPISLRRSSKKPWREFRAIWEIIKIYRAEHPSIVHHVALKPVLYGSLAAKIAGVPAVVNALAGMGFVFASERKAAKILRPLLKLALRLVLGRERVVLQNPDDARLLVSSGVVRNEQISLIRGSGVDLSEFRFVPEPEVVPPLVVLPARMLWDKGVGEFVEAAAILRKGAVVARFALAGGRDRENLAAIPLEQLQAWQDEGVVEWLGRQDDMPALFAQAHIVCLPSYREGLPKALIEAAACGRAIVTTDVPGCREVVKDGENGLLVPARDAAALAKALQRLLEDPELRRKMGERGHEIAAAEFSAEKVAAKTLEIYRELLR